MNFKRYSITRLQRLILIFQMAPFVFWMLIGIIPTSTCINNGLTKSSTANENAPYIDTAVTVLSTASSGIADVLMSLGNLNPLAAFLLKAIIPVGSAIVADLNPDPQSEEYKQLMDFKVRTDQIWLLNQRAINLSTKAIGMKIIGNQYFHLVTHQINLMKGKVDEFTNPKIHKSSLFESEFKRACQFGEMAPETILIYLHGRLVQSCRLPMNIGEVKFYAAQRAYLLHVALRLNVTILSEKIDIGPYVEEFLQIYDLLSDKSVLDIDKLAVFNRTFATFSTGFSEMFKELRFRGGLNEENIDEVEDCYLSALVKGANFGFPRIEAYALQLKEHLIDLGYFAGICANLTYDGHQTSMDEYAKRISDKIAQISKFTSNWLNVSLASSWPSIYQEILQEQLVKIVPDPGFVTKENLRIVIQLALPLFEKTGSQNFVYQGLIAKTDLNKFFFEGLEKFFSLNTNIYGFKTIINRIQLNYSDEMEKETVHYKMAGMAKFATQLNITIQKEMGSLYNADNITEIAYKLKDKMGGDEVISINNFHSWTILRQYGDWPWDACPTIEYTHQAYRYGKLSGINTLIYTTNGGFLEDCEIFKFIFFI